MGCGEFLVKYILFFTNLFFALAGLALLGVGVAVKLQVKVITDLVDLNGLALGSVTIIVVGSIVFLIAFYGCCGAIRESNCMLVTYSIFMILLMVFKIALAVLIFVNTQALIEEVQRQFTQMFQSRPDSFHEIETAFNCCGPSGPISYGTNVLNLPASCCASTPCTLVNAYGGCNSKVADYVDTYSMVIGLGAIVVGAIELVAVVFGLCLANHVRNKNRRSHY